MDVKNKMKAAMLYGIHDIRIEEIDVPKIIEEEDVLIKVGACGVCPTDVRSYTGTSKPPKYPVLLGHEVSGEIVEMGKMAKKYFIEGQRVTILPAWPCHMCTSCRLGLTDSISIAMCDNFKGSLGPSAGKFSENVGGFAEYIKVPADVVYPIPDNLSYEEAALVEPMGSCLNAVEWGAKVEIGDNVLVIGAGFMGVATAQFCKIRGGRVIISDLFDDKLEIAKKMGVDRTVNVKKENIVEAVNEFTNGRGADKVIIAVGGVQPLQDAMATIGKAGRIVLLGSYHPPIKVEIDPNLFHYKMVTLTGIEGFTAVQFQKIISLLSYGTISVKPLITGTFKLEKIEDAFKMVEKGEGMRKVVKFE
ncbi:zinc-dependent alcohol dehydrogenase [Caldisericum sp.]|uniref:zinc-dependent alcohol dehydrogenase n=1 Tax=Caldisericum sp. TaxID=2499687 RepID=UPI003D1322B1